ncbi:MAG: bifunctional (p)ppGpp synthetase/guanosine-3',5'-bis(diphosphate) 3'-pyrophosphohydrolase [Desulfatitalea sp.]|nr:bifunctional (p)ppGpp synthetase/guanosine-3',5'-bis(diphosphate) 3'-pyrophosphohydrolase [Desulfatitalea sp.]NNK01717.1 bifunctional (p)ppGpp synthetase/guanosine-3',5'-bis(diphosphate) 3'-pyrophosphohydrolase [Desulfatitalea sp.]
MIRISDIIDRITEYNPDADLDLIDRAYIFSAKVHDGQVRLSGEPYLSHPLEVAGLLAEMKLDVVSVAAGLLHDVVEDTHASIEAIADMFGPKVSHIVSGVTKLSTLPFSSDQARQAESIRKMLLAMADDIRVILIKLADRMHNMRTLQYHTNPAKQRKIARETLDIYTPIASRLGIYWMKNELENIAFKYLLPEEHVRIEGLVATDKAERDKYIETVKAFIRKKMDENHLSCEVMGRYKNAYSIYQKMQNQNLTFEEVYDVIAFRIILDTIPQCYEALGLVHALWKPIAKKFKDYIGMPKPNMYQSLHTTVIGPYGERIEIQIRTRDMDRVAQSGIAAHWSYKEGKTADLKTAETFAWVRNIVENQANIKDPDEFLENVRIDLFPDDVYVFTPTGQIKSLPKGATCVDFAYAIHSEVGDQCVGAKVNGRMVPLKYQLQTGESVTILTQKGHQPSKDWLNFVKTVKARSKIRQWIKTQEKERSRTLGREMCEKAFRKVRLNFSTLSKSPEMDAAVDSFGFKTLDDLIIAIGYGKITPLQLVRKLLPKTKADEEQKSLLSRLTGRVRKRKIGSGVIVKGVEDILVRFGKCCQPVPGDSITGFITRGFGVTVHRSGCTNVVNTNSERLIDVEWDSSTHEAFPVQIKIRAADRMGLLADVAACISKSGANILSANTQTLEDKTVASFFTLQVSDTDKLNRIISGLKKIKQVLDVDRVG